MRRVRKLALVAAVAALASSGVFTMPAGAQGDGRPGDGTVDQSDDGGVDLRAADGFVPAGTDPTTGSGGDSCPVESTFEIRIDDDFDTPVSTGNSVIPEIPGGRAVHGFYYFRSAEGQPADTRLFSETGRWFLYGCAGDFYFIPEGGPPIFVPDLIQEAIDSIDPPDPTLAITPDHGKHVVNMPSWFAVDPAYWNQARNGAARAGRVVVTATLTPYEVEWDPGNGETLTPCPNPGTVWSGGMGENQNTCPYTYPWPSINPPDNTWEISGTIRFEVGYTSNAPGTYGPFDPVERTNTETIQALEIQAIGQ